MRRTIRRLPVLFLGVILMLTLFGCGKKNHTQPQNSTAFTQTETVCVTFINEVGTADVWVLPQTEENLKTSLWGKATIAKLGAGEQREIRLAGREDTESFLIRIIDGEHTYYAVNDVLLEDGYLIRFTTQDSKFDAVVEILDADENVLRTQAAFAGVLGAN